MVVDEGDVDGDDGPHAIAVIMSLDDVDVGDDDELDSCSAMNRRHERMPLVESKPFPKV